VPEVGSPSDSDPATVLQIVLRGLARNADVNDLANELEPFNPKRNTFPAELLLDRVPCQATFASLMA